MSDKTWIVLKRNGVNDKVFEQSGRPESMQMTNLSPNTQYVAQAGLESGGLQTLALQTATFSTLQAGTVTLTYSSHARSGSTDTVVYAYTSTYAPSSAILASTISGVTTNYQGVIDSNAHTVTFTISDWSVGSTYTVSCTMHDIYGETATSAATSITVEDPSEGGVFYIENTAGQQITLTLSKTGEPAVPDLKYKIGGGSNWSQATTLSDGYLTINLPTNTRCYFKGKNTSGFNRSDSAYFKFNATGSHVIGGNLMSIVDEDNFATINSIPPYSFNHLFAGDTNLTSAADANFGVVVNTSQGAGSDRALENTFDGCSALVYPPDTSTFEYLGNRAMHYCFANCVRLARAADLSNVRLINRYCLEYCYENCQALTTGSNFLNIGNTDEGYIHGVYYNCSNLSTAYYPNVESSQGVNQWLYGCAATGTIYVTNHRVALHVAPPSGWTVVELS